MNYSNHEITTRLFAKNPVEVYDNYYSTLSEEIEWHEKMFGGELPSGLEETKFYDLVREKWNIITTTGFTIDEFQKAMVFICIVRFILYSIRYNPITAFKICAISGFSCFLWAFSLNDCVTAYVKLFKYNKLFQNMEYEHRNWDRYMFYSTQEKLYQRAMQVALGQRSRYHFEWLAPLFSLVPEKYHYLTDPAFDYIKKELYGDLIKFFKTYIRPEMPQILFTLVVRVGKRYCPYHVRWHACFIVTMGFFTQIPWDTARRANRMIYETLLPEYRYQEVEDLQIWIGCLIFAHVSIVCLAMLHAVFSQYFYVPFIVYNLELHIGPRPTKSIYSGGYTAWQDEFVFYDPNYREMRRLWWGLLGRGVKKRPKKRRRKKK